MLLKDMINYTITINNNTYRVICVDGDTRLLDEETGRTLTCVVSTDAVPNIPLNESFLQIAFGSNWKECIIKDREGNTMSTKEFLDGFMSFTKLPQNSLFVIRGDDKSYYMKLKASMGGFNCISLSDGCHYECDANDMVRKVELEEKK